MPKVKDYAKLNAYLRQKCLEERQRISHGQTETIGERFERDRAAAMTLPTHPFVPCVSLAAKVDKYQTVRYDNNRYSVPRRWTIPTYIATGNCRLSSENCERFLNSGTASIPGPASTFACCNYWPPIQWREFGEL